MYRVMYGAHTQYTTYAYDIRLGPTLHTTTYVYDIHGSGQPHTERIILGARDEHFVDTLSTQHQTSHTHTHTHCRHNIRSHTLHWLEARMLSPFPPPHTPTSHTARTSHYIRLRHECFLPSHHHTHPHHIQHADRQTLQHPTHYRCCWLGKYEAWYTTSEHNQHNMVGCAPSEMPIECGTYTHVTKWTTTSQHTLHTLRECEITLTHTSTDHITHIHMNTPLVH